MPSHINIFLLMLSLLIAHLGAAAVLISWIYPRLRAPTFKYLSSRGLLIVALLTVPLPVYAFLTQKPQIETFLVFGVWSLYGGAVIFLWIIIILKLSLNYLRNGQKLQRLFWESPARKFLEAYKPSKESKGGAAFLLGRLYNNIYRPVIREVILPVPGLPRPLSGFKILHVTDTHMGKRCGPDFYDAVLEEIQKIESHIVLHAGDIISMNERSEYAARWLGDLGKRSQYGAYCVLGNHDLFLKASRLSNALRKRGVRRLSHSWADLIFKTKRIILAGSESPWELGEEKETISAGLSRGGADLILGLAHEPAAAMRLLSAGAQVAFCGHTHGGQIRLGTMGPLIVTALHGGRYPHGLYGVAGGTLLVSGGLGSYIPPGRLGCPPEILLVTLCRG